MTAPPLAHRLTVDLALARLTFRRRVAYRVNWLFTVVIGGGGMLASLALWRHLLDGGAAMGGYDWDAMRAYLVLGFITMTVAVGGADFDIADRILDGMVAIDLTKPVDFQRARAAEYIGSILATVPGAAFSVALAALLVGLPGPASPLAGALTAVSVLLSLPLSFCLTFLSVLTCFWVKRYLGVMWAREAVTMFFSGMLVPLALFPDPLRALAWSLPFAHFTGTPTGIYLGRFDLPAALGLLAAQAAWVVALWWLARLLWSRAITTVTVHGG
ncbi:ABC-2 family transporter protein [Glycomyces sp. A-F 0318]|uniref:ABC transporter permease n=1 Tax=Glycomyces amatae TaxID=2881355 RepID=UPI001E576EC6|nr:ABC-2 family transporter protein [Glycomyces amatae]MCD0444885.1 ABC-2 family transporter protein [Glycomyces amatae]